MLQGRQWREVVQLILLRAAWFPAASGSTTKPSPPKQRESCPSSPHTPSSLPYLCTWAGVPGPWDFLPSACPSFGPGHLRADVLRGGVFIDFYFSVRHKHTLMPQTPQTQVKPKSC